MVSVLFLNIRSQLYYILYSEKSQIISALFFISVTLDIFKVSLDKSHKNGAKTAFFYDHCVMIYNVR